MKQLQYIIFGGIALVLIAVLLIPSPSVQVNENYFSEDAAVMYFYSDGCGWCNEQKIILSELGEQGYRVKGMNVGVNPGLWAEYQVDATPTFIGPDNERLRGYKEKEVLKAFLDNYK